MDLSQTTNHFSIKIVSQIMVKKSELKVCPRFIVVQGLTSKTQPKGLNSIVRPLEKALTAIYQY
ncbi:hypothetical protein A0J61_08305 [Choanephora cucurbitarum]|uniref:Uncharacterized protein n=1 Tax=Choanephora cucurbitarum TaxID=101091 RepID=A0A1C7N3E6_9FUNG|nr:hypothetical protein A0J61_08305 [Choanephora cucurbitarum]